MSKPPLRIVVTGASGFVGRALAARALAEGASVFALARRATQAGAPGAAPIDLDLLDLQASAGAFADIQPDIILHAAGRTAPPRDWSERLLLWRDNLSATETLLEAARLACPRAALVIIGSAAQYGPPADPDRRISESDPWRPAGLYGATKAAAAMAALERARNVQSRVTIPVLFNLVGPGQSPHLVPGAFLSQMRGEGPHEICVGDTAAQRDFLDVRDAARAVWRLALKSFHTGRGAGVVNVCRGEGASIDEILRSLRTACGGGLVWKSHGVTDPVRSVVGDPTLLRDAIGFSPAITIGEAVRDMWRASRAAACVEG